MKSKRPSGTDDRVLGRIELGSGIALLALAIAVRLSFLTHAGPLWRDEVISVNIGAADSVGATLGLFRFDSFPVLWSLVVHTWTALGLGRTDFLLRVLGVSIGIASVGVLLSTVRRLGCRIPLLSPALFALSPTAIVWGDEVRGYALGLAALLFLLAAIWGVVENPLRRTVAVAAVAALLAVHSSFGSSSLLLCLCLGGGVVSLLNRSGRTVGMLLCIGALAAATMLAYVPMVASIREWNVIVEQNVAASAIFRKFEEAVGGAAMLWLWIALLALSTALCLRAARAGDDAASPREKDLARFLVIATWACLVGYFVYLKNLKLPTQAWYYLPPMGILAVLFEVAIDRAVRRSARGRVLRLALVVAVVGLLAKDSWGAGRTRMTNIDLVASALEARAGAEDLIVVTPWYVGVTFHRYYHGATPWVTVPDFGERRFQLYGELKQKMSEIEPIRPVLDRISNTLGSGHRIWVVGALPYLSKGQLPEVLPPAPMSPAGWSEGSYSWVWLRQTAYRIQTHSKGLATIPVRNEGPANPFENQPLYSVEN